MRRFRACRILRGFPGRVRNALFGLAVSQSRDVLAGLGMPLCAQQLDQLALFGSPVVSNRVGNEV